jgi:hypothetical protein
MKLKTLLIINAIVLGVSGIFAVLKPAMVCTLYGVDINPEVLMMSQYAGLGSIAVALVAWFSRRIKDSRTLRGILLALLITYAVGMIISVQNTISGVIAFGWPVMVLYSVFAIGYAYFLFSGQFKD